MVITLCYDAISRNVEGLGVSPFVMFTLSATAIFPACVVLLLLQDVIGRKAMASSSLLVSGIFTASTGVLIAIYQGSQGTGYLDSCHAIMFLILTNIFRCIPFGHFIRDWSFRCHCGIQFGCPVCNRIDPNMRSRSRSSRCPRGWICSHVFQLLHSLFGM